VKLSDLKGKFVVLEWTNNKCPFVKKHYDSENMQSLQKKYTGEGVVWISVNSSAEGKEGFVTDAEAAQIVKDRGAAPSHVIRDPSGEIGHLYGAKTTPHMFIIDREGKVAYAGAIDDKPTANIADVQSANNYITKAFNELMANKPVSVSATHSYGCSVKY
jgi:peroxiredoxin